MEKTTEQAAAVYNDVILPTLQEVEEFREIWSKAIYSDLVRKEDVYPPPNFWEAFNILTYLKLKQ